MSLLTRLREALLPDFEVDREIGRGGMGTVFLAREVALDRPVAIKIIRPEDATASAVDRFLREARTLAQLSHPNIVPVHHVGNRDGLFYYVMEFVRGETLAERLARGTLTPEEARKLGRDLLDALEIAHKHDVIHRDVKPQNIFLVGDRYLLGDFGIATSSNAVTVTDSEGRVIVGTPPYMPPEQRYGWEVGPRTDLYAVGLVLYEALTQRRWSWFLPDDKPDWSKVPRRSGMLPVLQRALAYRPADRWPDAKTFRHALWRTRARKYRARTLALTVGGVAAGAVIGALLLRPPAVPPAGLVITEFQTAPGVDSVVGVDLAVALHSHLQGYRNGAGPLGLVAVSELPPGEDPNSRRKALRADAYLEARASGSGDSIEVQLLLVTRNAPPAEIRASGRSIWGVACDLGRAVLRNLGRSLEPYRCRYEDAPARANDLFLAGERAFRQQAWSRAESLYAAVLDLYPANAWARWRLLNAQRWRRERPYDEQLRDLGRLYEQQGQDLIEGDRHLLEAWLTPFGPARFEKYLQAIADLPRDPYSWLVYGDDLFARGALVGISLDSVRKVLERAVLYDSMMGPALMDLAWVAIRRGDTLAAREALGKLRTSTEDEGATIPTHYFELAFFQRFGSPEERGAAMAAALAPGSGNGDGTFLRMFRWGLAFDLAPAQLAIADLILSDTSLPPPARTLVLEARGLALATTGRYLAALAAFDEVAALSGAPEATLQAAQWRVLPRVFGLEAVPDAIVDSGVAVLASLAVDSGLADRADWTLAMDAYSRGDAAGAQQRLAAIRSRANAESADLVVLLEALQRVALGDTAGALAATEALAPYVASERGSEPFLRSAIYLMRGKWKRTIAPRDLPAEWIWHLNADLRGWPEGLAQAGEIDWAFGPYARLQRARALLRTWDRAEGCGELARITELWDEVDAVYEPLRDEALTLRTERCR